MNIDYTRVYRVIMNNLPWTKKPTLSTLRMLTQYLPDAKILGFGYYDHYKLWYLMVYSPTFPINPWATASNLAWHQAIGTNPMTMTDGWKPIVVS